MIQHSTALVGLRMKGVRSDLKVSWRHSVDSWRLAVLVVGCEWWLRWWLRWWLLWW